MTPSAPGGGHVWAWLPGTLAAALLIVTALYTWPYVEDDAYIHCQFARNLLERGEFSFNPGEIVFGDTSPLWVFLLVAIHHGGVSFVTAAKLLGWLATALAGWLFVALAERVARTGAWTPERRGWVFALFMVHPFFLGIMPTGMETPLALAFLLAFALLLDRFWTAGPCPGLVLHAGVGLLAGVSPLLRPEFVLLGPCGGLAMLLAGGVTGWRKRVIPVVVYGIAWGLVLATEGALCMAYFGTVLPTTLGAKAHSTGMLSLGAFAHTVAVLVLGFGPLAALVLMIGRSSGTGRLPASLRCVPAALWSWSVLLLAGYTVMSVSVQSRYILLVWPVVAAGVVVAITTGVEIAKERFAWIAAVLVLLAQGGLTVFPALCNRVRNTDPERVLVETILTRTDPESVLGVYAIGEIGFRTQRRIVDFGCIVTPEMRHVPQKERLSYGIQRGVTHAIFLTSDLSRLRVPLDKALCIARFRHTAWQFPPWRYREGTEVAMIPISAIPDPARGHTGR